MFETAGATSNLFNTNNNLYGMKHPTQRATTSMGADQRRNARYIDHNSSVTDLILYMDAFNYPKDLNTAPALVNFMKSKGYFEEDLNVYLRGVEAYQQIL